MDKTNLYEAHRYCNNNRSALLMGERCGCFYCLRVYSPREITEWIDSRRDTALCPYCGIDAVLGENAGYPLTADFLKEMHDYWF